MSLPKWSNVPQPVKYGIYVVVAVAALIIVGQIYSAFAA